MRQFIAYTLLAALAAGGCARPTQPNARSADVLTGDTKTIQGLWAIESFEDGTIEHLTGEAKKDAAARMREIRIAFEGRRMTVIERGEEEPMAFSLDESKNPKVLTLTLGGAPDAPARGTARAGTSYGGTARAGTSYGGTARAGTIRSGTAYGTAKGGPPVNADTWSWIYKFEGDALVVAFVKGDRKAVPTEFKARAAESAPGKPPVLCVTVITLRKTDERPAPARPGTSRGTSRAATFRGTSK